MRILVVEDEPPARAKLVAALRLADPEARIAGETGGVDETLRWLETNPAPDLMFLDVQLNDGSSFDLLRRAKVECPVIFATAYDEYLQQAFETQGIDYLLKPVRPERVTAAIQKYRKLRDHFAPKQSALLDWVDRRPASPDRLLVRKGIDFIPVKTSEIAYFYTSDKLVFLVSKAGRRYLLDRPLAELEAMLDPGTFFRANRAFLVHIQSVIRCRAYGKGKLLVELEPPPEQEVLVSQERTAQFRQWLGDS